MTSPSSTNTWRHTPQPSRTAQAAGAARQIRDQRRGYARVVLRALASRYHGRPTSQVQRVLSDSLKPLGVGLSPAALHELAVNITAGRPVELP